AGPAVLGGGTGTRGGGRRRLGRGLVLVLDVLGVPCVLGLGLALVLALGALGVLERLDTLLVLVDRQTLGGRYRRVVVGDGERRRAPHPHEDRRRHGRHDHGLADRHVEPVEQRLPGCRVAVPGSLTGLVHL